MANLRKDDGVIRDENLDVRRDSGESVKDNYERADAYEKDRIELRGIAFFTLGLVMLIGVTFGLMALLQNVMQDASDEAYAKDKTPMAMSREENLPPEPRLQAAPGFGVEDQFSGKDINLELREPQSEYRELKKQWERVWREGRKDKNSGTVITMSIEDAKKKVLEMNTIKTRPTEQNQKAMQDVQQIPSYSSAGRMNELRRQ